MNSKIRYMLIIAFSFCLMVPAMSTFSHAQTMEVLKSDIDVGTSIRHEWFPFVEYNPVDNDFLAVWHTGGKRTSEDTISHDSIDGQRLSSAGELLGEPFVLSPPEPGWKTLPKLAHNKYTNEYGVTFTTGPEFIGQNGFIGRLNSAGEYVSGPTQLYETPYNISHPTIIFNPVEREFLAAYNENFEGTDMLPGKEEGTSLDNIGFILNEDCEVTKGPFMIGSQEGTQFNPQLGYNPTNNTYMVNWEDFRNVGGMWDSSDIYGALLDAEGDMQVEIPMIDDFEGVDEGDQRVQKLEYNPDKDEFLAAWRDKRDSLDGGAGIVGVIVKSDGSLAGGDFTIIDAAEGQSFPQYVYVQKKKQYFMVWDDTRNGDSDIYAQWLNSSGKPIGDAIPICTDPGNQGYSNIAYNPLMEQFLITWRDENAPDDFDVLPDEGGGHIPGTPGDIQGALYGKPSFLTCRVVEEGTENPVEGALALVFGPSVPGFKLTNEGGWFAIGKTLHFSGPYLVFVFKSGYSMAMQSVQYQGEPLQMMVEMVK